MLSFPAAIKVYLCTVACYMRRSFDRLAMMAEHIIGCNPFSGHLLVFCNRRSDRVKILYWDRDGWAIWYQRLEYVPASFQVIEEACRKYACAKGCTVVTAEKPAAPIEKGLPGPGLLVQVAVSKYGDHVPLYRQEEIYQRQGVELSRQTMSDWMRQAAELAGPVVELMKERGLSSKAVQTDDTPVPVLDPELPRTRTGRIWTYVGDAEHPYTVYDYTPRAAGTGPRRS